MKRDAAFYFANLGADISRCISAAQHNDSESYDDSIDAAYRTLAYITNRPEAYEEGLLLLRGLEYAREENRLSEFNDQLNELITEYSPLV
ncbi:MAG: hypothetical protein AAB734_02415 [Patescibacteria group bacterium]|mgnify:CR=1